MRSTFQIRFNFSIEFRRLGASNPDLGLLAQSSSFLIIHQQKCRCQLILKNYILKISL